MRTKIMEKLIYLKDTLTMVCMFAMVIGVVAFMLTHFDIQQVSGHSMDPTFDDGDIILVALGAQPEDGDVVILTTSYIDNYEVEGDHVIKRYYEEYSTDGLYVLGDNAQVSYDSRYYGEAPVEACQGVVVCDISKGIRNVVATITSIF